MYMRAAIVGCGQISRAHVSALNEIDGIDICAVCDRDKWRAQESAKQAGGASAYTDLAMLLRDGQPDSVHILTPPNTHAELAIQAMEAGCHALVEKPFALSVVEADSMLAAAQHNGVQLCAGHNYLFKPSVTKARELVNSGAIGQVVYVHTYYGLSGEAGSYSLSAGRSHWAWSLPGGVFTNFLPHLIYLQLAFLPNVGSVAGVSLGGQPGFNHQAAEMMALLEGDGASGAMTISMRARPYAKFVDIYGTNGTIHADLVREFCTIHPERRLPRMLSKAVFSLEDSVQVAAGTAASTARVALGRMKSMPGLRALVREFYGSIASGQAPPVPPEEARRSVEVMEMVWDKTPARRTETRRAVSPPATTVPRTRAERIVIERGMPGKVLVTGATGFLGHRLVAALARCKLEVVALVRDKSLVSSDLQRQAELIVGDLRDPASIEASVRDAAIVYHCAAITSNRASWASHFETNVRSSETLFERALEAGVQRVIHVSSVVVYGLHTPRGDGVVSESTPYGNVKDKWAHYMRAKIEAEKLAFRYWSEEGLPVTVLRLGILYGPGGRRGIAAGMGQLGPVRLLAGRGNNRLPYTYVDNAVDSLLLAAVSPQAVGQAFNVVDDPQVSVRKIALQSMRIAGEDAKLVPLPPLLLTAVAGFMELRAGRRGAEEPPRLSRYVVRSACRDIQYDTTKAREWLEWSPAVTLEEGLRNTLG
jgi:predicted dehydrogenase/nucleoside-diphosphate-sugar epimerase